MLSTRSICQAARRVTQSQHAPFRISRAITTQPQRHLHLARPLPSPSRLRTQYASTRVARQIRCETTLAAPRSFTDDAQQPPEHDTDDVAARKAQEPAYEMHFTCRKCLERSAHRITKQAYHHGTTLITCPGCKGRHLISDHLRIFSDKSITVEDMLREKGQYLRKGRLGEDGDIEFYDDQEKKQT